MFKFGSRSEKNLVGVNPKLVAVARRALELSTVDFTVIEGVRTVERQKEMVATGKSQTMNSRHIGGFAIDVFPVGGTWKVEEFMPVLHAFYKAGQELGVELRFGRNWARNPDTPYKGKFIDAPHIELPA